jgi:hypothetical protein
MCCQDENYNFLDFVCFMCYYNCICPCYHKHVDFKCFDPLHKMKTKKMESMEFVQRGLRGQTPNPNFFGIIFGRTEKNSGDGLGR